MGILNMRDEACHEVLSTIRKIIRAVDIHSKRLRLETGITGPQLIILKEIYQSDKITTTVLAEKISLSQSTVTNILDRLVDKDLVVKIRDTIDKRMWFLKLTEAGKNIVGSSPTLLQKQFIDNFTRLPEWQQTQMLSTLQRIAAMMCGHTEEINQQTLANSEQVEKS